MQLSLYLMGTFCGAVYPKKSGRLDGWTVGRLDGWTVGRLDGWTVGRLDDCSLRQPGEELDY